MTTPRLPRALLAVAILFILEGIHAIYRTASGWSAGHGSLPLDVISILVGLGLLRRRKRWWSFAVAWLWFAVVSMMAYLTWFVFSGRPATIAGPAPAWLPPADTLLAGYSAGLCLLSLWGISVLTSRNVVSFYEELPVS